MSSKARLDRLEATVNRRVLEDLARQHGLTVEESVEEVRAFEALPLPAQLANIDEHQAELRADGIDVQRLKADLIRARRPFAATHSCQEKRRFPPRDVTIAGDPSPYPSPSEDRSLWGDARGPDSETTQKKSSGLPSTRAP